MRMTVNTFIKTIYPVRHKLFRFAVRILKNEMDAEDIVQETFIRMWNRRSKLKEYRSTDAFALTITRNLCLDKIKSKGYRSDELLNHNIKNDALTPFKILEEKNTYMIIQKLISDLPEQQKMVIQLRDIEHHELDEIAEIMDMTCNNVRVTLSRARKTIRLQLKNNYNYAITNN